MASRFIGLNIGQHSTEVVEGSSTTSKQCEIVFDLTKFTTQLQVFEAMEAIKAYMLNQATKTPAI